MSDQGRGTRSERASGRRSARVSLQPLIAFLKLEAAGGILLLVATIAALAWANSPWSGSYERLWERELTIGIGSRSISADLRHWVNDGLMALFFFVVGLEIKRELVVGELREPRAAALPVLAAVGGMAMPAALYLVINGGGAGGRGWGIPMATDIAFAVGVLALIGRRAPPGIKIFLLSLAIVDDIGAIVAIAVFYAESLTLPALGAAAGLVGAILVARALGVRSAAVYLLLGLGVWIATFQSGVHATIAGVVLGLLIPARTKTGANAADPDPPPAPLDRLESGLHPWTSFFVVPLFVLANAGVHLSGGASLGNRISLGIIVGLVAGKTLGITLAAWGATRLGVARLPTGVGWGHIVGAAAVAGIGFTVSLLIAGLAFDEPGSLASAKLGILTASVAAGGLGAVILAFANSNGSERVSSGPARE